jgi:hypothetical protein
MMAKNFVFVGPLLLGEAMEVPTVGVGIWPWFYTQFRGLGSLVHNENQEDGLRLK